MTIRPAATTATATTKTTTTTTAPATSATTATATEQPAPGVRRLRRLIARVPSAPMRLQAALAEQRGDVPGWVLVTLMTAGLVLAIYGIASPALQGVFNRAIESVSGVR